VFTPNKGNEFGADATGDKPRDSSGQHALDAWESEGGAEALGLDAAHSALADDAGWPASNNAGWLANRSDKDALDGNHEHALELADEEDRILRCLGVAVIMRWNAIPTKLQKELFEKASSVAELPHAGALKGQIARFLHRHKDDAR